MVSIMILGPTQREIGVKRPENEALHSLLSSTEAKNAFSYISTPTETHINQHVLLFDWAQEQKLYLILTLFSWK